MADLVDVIIEDDRWLDLGLEPLAETAAQAVFAYKGYATDGFEISLLACDDQRIATLNQDFRSIAKATNVLSWPSQDRYVPGQHPSAPLPDELGDIAIAYETCLREATETGKPPKDHVQHLVIHAILHLLGYDHETEADAVLMEGLEITILETLGIADPYRILNG